MSTCDIFHQMTITDISQVVQEQKAEKFKVLYLVTTYSRFINYKSKTKTSFLNEEISKLSRMT